MDPEATTHPPTLDRETVYFLSLSGGAWRGAVQYWVIVHLLKHYAFQSIHGVSVGSINGVCAAMGKMDLLLEFWDSVNGLKGYLSFRWLYLMGWFFGIVQLLEKLFKKPIMGGVYSMKGLHNKLLEYAKLDDIKTPFVAGVVSQNSGTYHELDSRDMQTDERLALACLASSCMSPFMTPPLIHLENGGEPEAGFDGGGRHIFPVPEKEALAARREGKKVIIHALGCMPMERIKPVPTIKVSGLVELALRGLDILQAEVYETDLLQLRKAVGPSGEVHLWLPSEHPGGSFEADRDTIARRLELGKKTVEAGPTILPGI